MSPDWEVSITSRVARQLVAYDALTRLEVGGMGLVTDASLPDLTKNRTFYINKLWMMSAGEEASSGYCEIPAKERASLMFGLAKKGKSDLLKVWWHKHPISTWSGTDTSTMRQRVEEFRPKGVKSWALGLVLTPTGFLARYDQAGDENEDNCFVDLPVYIGRAVHDPVWTAQVTRMERRYQKSQPMVNPKAAPQRAVVSLDIAAITREALKKAEANRSSITRGPVTIEKFTGLATKCDRPWVSAYDDELRQYVLWSAEEAHGGRFFCQYYGSLQRPSDCPGCSRALICYPDSMHTDEDNGYCHGYYQGGEDSDLYQQLAMLVA